MTVTTDRYGTGELPVVPGLQCSLTWTVSPTTPAASIHAELLRAVAAEVHRQPFGSYATAEIAGAAEDLLAALTSQLPADASGEVAAVAEDFDERAAGEGEAVQAGSLIALYGSGVLNGPRALAHLEAALAGGVGVAWGGPQPTVPGWEQCCAHLLADLRSGRIAAVLDPGALGRIIFPGEAPVDCSGCAVASLSDEPQAAAGP